MDSKETLSQRIADLEARLEFQDETIARLNDEMVVQQQRYLSIRKQLQLLVSRLKDKEPDMLDPSEEPPPPHY